MAAGMNKQPVRVMKVVRRVNLKCLYASSRCTNIQCIVPEAAATNTDHSIPSLYCGIELCPSSTTEHCEKKSRLYLYKTYMKAALSVERRTKTHDILGTAMENDGVLLSTIYPLLVDKWLI